MTVSLVACHALDPIRGRQIIYVGQRAFLKSSVS
jgi:hypothetical protein